MSISLTTGVGQTLGGNCAVRFFVAGILYLVAVWFVLDWIAFLLICCIGYVEDSFTELGFM